MNKIQHTFELNPDEKFNRWKKRFETKYSEFLSVVNDILLDVKRNTNNLGNTIIPLNNPDQLRKEMEDKFNLTRILIDGVLGNLTKTKNKSELKYFAYNGDNAKLPEVETLKNNKQLFELIYGGLHNPGLYYSYAIASSWEKKLLVINKGDKIKSTKWTIQKDNEIRNKVFELSKNNNSAHMEFIGALDRRIAKDKK